MTSEIKTRMNYTTSDGMKTVFPETKAKLIRLEGHTFANLQELLDGSGTFRVSDGTLQVLDKSTGGWSDVIIEGDSCEHPGLPPIDNVLTNVTELSAIPNGKNVTVKWKDPKDVTVQVNDEVYVITKWMGTKLVYKEGSEPVSPEDGILVIDSTERDQFVTEGKTITDLTPESTYFFKLFPYDDKGRVVIDTANSASITISKFEDESGSPGPSTLLGGDETAGFFGEVTNEELISTVTLASSIGLSEGKTQNEDTPWLKFVLDGKILYTTKKPIRYAISWDSIHSVGAAYGTKIIKIGNLFYRVRLFKGAKTDPYSSTSSDRGAKGSEWNRLMLPIHIQAKDKSWAYPDYVEDTIPDWNIGYTDADLILHYENGNGYYTWCQETPTEYETYRTGRGSYGASYSDYGTSSNTYDYCGWRPVLELVSDEEIADTNNSPGSPVLVAGDTSAGFFGEVPNTELINPLDLATNIGLSAGTSYNTDTPWLKFSLDGKILFTTKKPIRYNLSWDTLNNVDAVYGRKVIKILDKYYKVRLFKGVISDPYLYSTEDRGAKGSEWNRLMLPIHAQAKDGSWTHPKFAEVDVPDWGVGYTDEDLLLNYSFGTGSRTWCQETPTEYPTGRAFRGYTNVSGAYYNISSGTSTDFGWRPVLELVPEEEIVDKTGSPGSPVIIGGDSSAGFFGEVPSTEFTTGSELSGKLSISSYGAISLTNSDTPWLKFSLDGKIVFIPKKPIGYSVSWKTLYDAKSVYGNSVVKIRDHYYRVRLIKGASKDPFSNSDITTEAKGSEWNRLMLPIHIQAKDKSWTYPNYVDANVPDWGIGYKDSDLGTTSATAAMAWCQEQELTVSTNIICRGYGNVTSVSVSNSTSVSSSNGWRPLLELVDPSELDDLTGTPGSPVLIGGDTSAGFFGEVTNSEFITPTILASSVGLATGTSYNTDTPWLKFILDGKILFTTKKPIRYSISWDQINAANLVYGNKTVQIGTDSYKVRLFKGAISDPFDDKSADNGAKGSEWNRLMLPINVNVKNSSWNYKEYVDDVVPDWGIGYTDSDLMISSGSNGGRTWCQESDSTSGYRLCRGYLCTEYSSYLASSTNVTSQGWRPVLEYIPKEELKDTSGAPGPVDIKAGDRVTGFYGEFPNTELITPIDLASTIGLSAGTSYNEDTPWLKFSLDGKILFTTKKPIRNNVSWNHINTAKAVDGTNIIDIKGKKYKVRLFRGVTSQGDTPKGDTSKIKTSEWNRLMIPIHIKTKNKSWSYPAYVDTNTPYWGIDYTDADLGTDRYETWCYEETASQGYRYSRGYPDVSYVTNTSQGSAASSYVWRPILEYIPDELILNDDITPGPNVILGGNTSTGFFGEVSNTEFITPTTLASTIGLTSGTSFNEDTPWLKFILDGRILFTTKKPIRYSVSWDSINAIGAAKGSKIISLSDNYYRVRLFKGALNDPYSYNATDKEAKGSEWNRLMLPIHAKAKDKSWAYPAYVEGNVPNWNIGYTDADLLTHSSSGNGSYTWCQETPTENSSQRLMRGNNGVSFSNNIPSSDTTSNRGWRPVLELLTPEEVEELKKDTTGSPGPSVLKAGDKTAGFYGEVPNTELITPVNLASNIGLSAGTSFNEDTPWLKFSLDGKILFTTKKTIRHTISWNQINAVGAVDGTKTIKIGDKLYKVRLFRGALTNPYSNSSSDQGAKGSEWNRLMLPIYIKAKGKTWGYPAYVEDNLPDWGIGYTDDDLHTKTSNLLGNYTWCQENPSTATTSRLVRGANCASFSTYYSATSTTSSRGWRPVLELVDPSEIADTSGSPGSSVLRAGDKSAGFFGEVPNSELITPVNLASTIGLTKGTSYNEDTPWLKFILDDKILFVAKKPIRNNLTWQQIDAVGAVYGTTTVQAGGKTYKVRLLKGVKRDPYPHTSTSSETQGSEWNRLMLPIHIKAKDKSWGYSQFVESDIPDWGTGYTDSDLLTSSDYGSGTYNWCQETSSDDDNYRAIRGYYDVSYASMSTRSMTGSTRGWRPVLELVE